MPISVTVQNLDPKGILPTKLEGYKNKYILPDIYLITDPSFNSEINKWTALANVAGILCLIELKVSIKEEQNGV